MKVQIVLAAKAKPKQAGRNPNQPDDAGNWKYAEQIAQKLGSHVGTKLSADDYNTWMNGEQSGKGNVRKFDKCVDKLFKDYPGLRDELESAVRLSDALDFVCGIGPADAGGINLAIKPLLAIKKSLK